MTAGPFLVKRLEPCDDCHGTGERHPTTRGFMSHEVRDCETCGRRGARVVSVKAFETLDRARDEIYDDARPMVCMACEAPGAPWRITPSYGAGSPEPVSCSCAGGPVDPIPAAGPDREDYESVRALFSFPAEGGKVELPDGSEIVAEATTLEEIDRQLTSLMAARGKVWTGSLGKALRAFNEWAAERYELRAATSGEGDGRAQRSVRSGEATGAGRATRRAASAPAITCGACGSTDTYGPAGNAGCRACGRHDQDGG